MAFSREQIEKAIAVILSVFGNWDSYELDGDDVTVNYKSHNGNPNRHIYIKLDGQDGEYSGNMTFSRDAYYPGETTGIGLGSSIRDALENPEKYEVYEYEDKRIYPEDNAEAEYHGVRDAGIVIGALTVGAGIVYLGYKGVCFVGSKVQGRYRSWRERKNEETSGQTESEVPNEDATEDEQADRSTGKPSPSQD